MNRLFHCKPQPNQGTFLENDWVVGASIHHPGNNKPSSIGVALATKPYGCAIHEMKTNVLLMPLKTQILTGRRMKAQFLDLLMKVLEDHQNKNELSAILPKSIMFLRDGLADNQISEFLQEEFMGLKMAVRQFTKEQKISWAPEFLALILTSRGIDDVCPTSADGQIVSAKMNEATMVIDYTISSPSIVEFLININPKDQRMKPKRYMVVNDSAGKLRTAGGMRYLGEFLVAMSWSFSYALPFSTGNPSLPSAVKMASKYAELMSQFLTTKDQNLDRFYQSTPAWRPTMLKESPIQN